MYRGKVGRNVRVKQKKTRVKKMEGNKIKEKKTRVIPLSFILTVIRKGSCSPGTGAGKCEKMNQIKRGSERGYRHNGELMRRMKKVQENGLRQRYA